MADRGSNYPAPRPAASQGASWRDRVGDGETAASNLAGANRHAPIPPPPAMARGSQRSSHASVSDAAARAQTYAALDLGTNNCRLLIARPQGEEFVIVDAYSRIVRLGEGLAASGRLSDAAMDRAIEALAVCADKLRRRHVTLSRAVATEACRRASNGDAFLSRVRKETGILLDVIGAEEEARLAVMGCHQLLKPGEGPALIFDIGGGSTELVLVDDAGDFPQVLTWRSVPWGVVTLTESEPHDSDDAAARNAGYAAMRARVREAMADFLAAAQSHGAPGKAPRLLGTSGTVTTLASVHLGLRSYDRSRVDGLEIACDELRHICVDLAGMSLEERAQQACIGRERADLVVAGCAVLEEILAIWPAASLSIADRGIREGVLRQLMHQPHARRAAPVSRR